MAPPPRRLSDIMGSVLLDPVLVQASAEQEVAATPADYRSDWLKFKVCAPVQASAKSAALEIKAKI